MKWEFFKPSKKIIIIYLFIAITTTILSFIVWLVLASLPPKSGLIGFPFGFIPVVGCGVSASGPRCDYSVSFNYLNLILDLSIWYVVAIVINYYKHKKSH